MQTHRRMRIAVWLGNTSGFTLVELMISTMIIGIIAMMGSTVILDVMPQHRLQSATQRLAWDLIRGRMEAIKQDQSLTVSLTNNHMYTIWRDINANGTIDVGEPIITEMDTHDSAPGVTIATGAPFPITIIYNSSGIPDNPVTFTVANASGANNVTISLTGQVDVP